MSTQRESIIHGYKITRDRRWDLFNALCLVQSLLGYQPERWHLERFSHSWTDRLGYAETRHYYQLHHRQNGQWRRRYIRREDARKLLNLGITNTRTIQQKQQSLLKNFMADTPT